MDGIWEGEVLREYAKEVKGDYYNGFDKCRRVTA